MPRISLLCIGLLVAPGLAGRMTSAATPLHGAIDYSIQIENTMGHEMDFFYSDNDSTEHTLGTIPPYQTQLFTIKSPARTSIVIIELGAAMGAEYDMRKTVELVADSVVSVAF